MDTPKGILLVRERSGFYSLPGGGARRQESRLAAAIRELEEETGLHTVESKFLFEHRGHFNSHKVFLLRAAGVPTPKKEVKGIRYYDGSNTKISSTTLGIIQRYLNLRGRNQQPPPASGLDPWKVLEVERNATREAIVASYRRLTKIWHPDAWPPGLSADQTEAMNDKMKEINEAFRLLQGHGFV